VGGSPAGVLMLHPRAFTLAQAAVSRGLAATSTTPAVATPATTAPAAAAAMRFRAAVPIQTMLLRSATEATPNAAYLHLRNPDLRPIFIPHGQARGTFALPTLISPVAPPVDTTVFEEPLDSSKTHYLPLYALAATTGPSGRVKWVSLSSTDAGFELDVHLSEVPNPSARPDGARIDADARYFITAAVAGRQVNWDLTAVAETDGAALKLQLAVPDFAGRDLLYQAMTDPAAGAKLIVRRSLPLAVPWSGGAGLYVAATEAVDTVIGFTFSKDLDANVFTRMGSAAGAPAKSWNVVAVNWNGRRHTYFQSLAQPDQVYYLPDAFKIMRQDAKPHAPALSVSAAGDDAESLVLTLAYLAQPVWNPERIGAAAPALQTLLSLSAPPSLALFEAVDPKLVLNVPTAGSPGASSLIEQPDALVDIAGGVRGSLSLDLARFRTVYDALFDQVSQVLSGEVRIVVEGTTAAIPFIARAGDFVGEVLDIESQVDVAASKLTATLTNAIESPIHVEGLKGSILKNGAPIPSTLGSVTPAPPIDLAPQPAADAATSSLTVILSTSAGQTIGDAGVALISGLLGGQKVKAGDVAAGLAGDLVRQTLDQSCTPLFDLSQVKVKPDPAAIWRAINQNQPLGPVNRQITLRAIAAMIQPAATDASAVRAIQVVFENGQTANFDGTLTADAGGFLNQTIKLSTPIEAYVLGNSDISSYRYRVDRITAGGITTGQWVSDNRDVVFLTSA
jgi:hypothetical protein